MVTLMLVKEKTAIPILIKISRVITITASQEGTIFRIARLTKADARSSLSAMGSRYAPITVRWLKTRAINPSKASLMPAIAKTRNAYTNNCFNNRMTKSGVNRILVSVKIFGILMGQSEVFTNKESVHFIIYIRKRDPMSLIHKTFHRAHDAGFASQ